MTQRLSRELAQKLVTAAEAGEWLPVGPERDRVKYWLPERINAGEWLCLIGFDEMDDDAADILTRHKGRLTLSKLICVSDISAQSLSLHDGNVLELDRLSSLSDPAAQSLSKYQGFLSLNGIATLTDIAAGALAQQQGGLSLDGLTRLADTPGHLSLARMLAAQPGSCSKLLQEPDPHFGGCRWDSGGSARHTNPGQSSSHRAGSHNTRKTLGRFAFHAFHLNH